MSKEKMLFCGKTDMGRQRTNNEDAFFVDRLDENTILAVAIDGVGGYEGGEVAAEIAQKEIPAYLKQYFRGERLELLKQAVVCANNAIYDRRQEDSARPDMSCVLTAALIDKGRKVVDMVHVGDTRMYQYHHGILTKLSHDHSLIGYREEIGDLTEEEAMHHPQRNVISRDVGSTRHEVGDPDFLEAEEFSLQPNSTFLLCSDGLTDMITSKQIIAILTQPISLKEKTQALIDAANEAGGKDNVTVVLVEYQAEEVQAPVKKDVVSSVEKNVEVPTSNVTVKSAPEKTKADKKERNKIVIALLVGACVILLVLAGLKSIRIKNLERRVDELENPTPASDTVLSVYVIDDLTYREEIGRYTKALEKTDSYDSLMNLYADTIRRYINYINISKERAVELFNEFDKKRKAIKKELGVQWETFTAKQLPNGEVSVDYIEDVKIIKQDSSEVLYVTHRIVTFNKEGKIVSVLEDLLQEGY